MGVKLVQSTRSERECAHCLAPIKAGGPCYVWSCWTSGLSANWTARLHVECETLVAKHVRRSVPSLSSPGRWTQALRTFDQAYPGKFDLDALIAKRSLLGR